MELFGVEGLPEVRPGDDLAALTAERADLQEGDVLCVSHTVVSKAEGRQADLADYDPGERARAIADRIGTLAGEQKDPRFARAVIEESRALLTEEPLLLAVTAFGHVAVNAGIDRSNVPDADLLLLPEDPTASARRLHEALGVPVVVTDTSGRPFRLGQRGVAIGWAGIPAARDWRGETDMTGKELGVTVEAVVDELAAAANLLTGEGDDGIPAVVVRGFAFGDHDASDKLFRDPAGDYVQDALEQWTYDPDRLRQKAGEDLYDEAAGEDGGVGDGGDDGDVGDERDASDDRDGVRASDPDGSGQGSDPDGQRSDSEEGRQDGDTSTSSDGDTQ